MKNYEGGRAENGRNRWIIAWFSLFLLIYFGILSELQDEWYNGSLGCQ